MVYIESFMPAFEHLTIDDQTPLPSPQDLLRELNPTSEQRSFINASRNEIKNILNGQDPRLLLIVGPCSIHDPSAAKEYALKLKELRESIADTFYVVMRVYFEKPRTKMGWKGMLHDPWLNGSQDIATGMRWTRKLLLELADMNIPSAAEFLDPSSMYYLSDLISWGCIGARTAASQTHRQMASGLPMPTGFKNSTDGNVDIAINGILSASVPHSFIGMNPQGYPSIVRTQGNQDCHLVLRGGKRKANYDPQAISHALNRLRSTTDLPLRLLIDCSHDNSKRQHKRQIPVFQSVIHQIIEGNQNIKGILLESHLNEGNQSLVADLSQLKYAVSITDPCLDWDSTEQLIRWGYAMLKRERVIGIGREDQVAVRQSIISV